jgi:O-antigen/teichoic acid export membrane protein
VDDRRDTQVKQDSPLSLWSASQVAQRALKAAFALGLRQVVVQGLNVIGGILLARILSPAEFGIYAICVFVLTFLTIFGDAGFGASLIRQSETPNTDDYRAVFTFQQVIVAFFGLVFWFIAPFVVSLYRLSPENIWIFRALVAGFLLTSFQTITTIQMERSLAFDRLAWIEVSQALTFNVSAVLLAFYGWGGLSFGIAILLRSLIGAVMSNTVYRWDLGWKWDFARVRPHLAYGIPYQASSVLTMLKDLINPLLIGILTGPIAVGYINWATTVANYPLIFILFFNRLFMPTLAKLTHDLQAFNKFLTLIIQILCTFVFTASAILYVFRFEIIVGIFGAKWLSAEILFAPFIIINLILAPTVVAMSALNALGESKFIFSVSLLWLVLTWFIGLIVIPRFGWQSWGWVNLCVNLANIFILFQITKLTNFSWLNAISIPLLIATLCFAVGYVLTTFHLSFLISITTLVFVTVVLTSYFLRRQLQMIFKNVMLKKVQNAE